jgi:DNA-directed RNA polymerase specialized sigma24 family protein
MEDQLNQLSPEQRQAVLMQAQQQANQQIMQDMIQRMVKTCFTKCAGTSVRIHETIIERKC